MSSRDELSTDELVRQMVHPLLAFMQDPPPPWSVSTAPSNQLASPSNQSASPARGGKKDAKPKAASKTPDLAYLDGEVETRPKKSPKGTDIATNASPKKRPDWSSKMSPLAYEFANVLLGSEQQRSKFLKNIRKLPFDVVLAALSLGLYIAGIEEAPNNIIKIEDLTETEPEEYWGTWQEWKKSAIHPPELKAIEKHKAFSDFSWIRKDATVLSKLGRLAVAATTLSSAFVRLQRQHGVPSESDLVANTEIIDLQGDMDNRRINLAPINIEHSPDDAMTVAYEEAVNGHKVAVMCSASSHALAGAFLTGGYHNIEEAMCSQTTLFFSLHQSAILAEARQLQDHKGRPVHIPDYGAILSPGVEVFRQSPELGYAPCVEYELAAVLSISMPNKNPNLKEPPPDGRTGSQYDQLLEKKFKAALVGAFRVGADVVIVPTMGGGELKNTPLDIGNALGRALAYHNHSFKKVILVGSRSTELQKAAMSTVQTHIQASQVSSVEDNDKVVAVKAVKPESTRMWPKNGLTTLFSPSLFTMSAVKSAEKFVAPHWAATGQNPMRTECARQLGRELKLKVSELSQTNAWQYADRKLTELCATKCSNSYGKIPSWKLAECLAECFDGEVPSMELLKFLTCSDNPFVTKRLVPLHEIQNDLKAWELYKFFHKDLELVFYLYDGQSMGKLPASEVVPILRNLCDENLDYKEAMAIMQQSELGIYGPLSRREFIRMVVRWHAQFMVESVGKQSCLDSAPCIKVCMPLSTFENDGWCNCSGHLDSVSAALDLNGRFQNGSHGMDESGKFKRLLLL
jgi:Ca2+-binding EF-hand superfamily protein